MESLDSGRSETHSFMKEFSKHNDVKPKISSFVLYCIREKSSASYAKTVF